VPVQQFNVELTMAATKSRPLSPHLTIWRWGPGMLVSILHRATGIAVSFAGLGILTWWLVAIAKGPEAYATFTKAATHPVGLVVLIGVTWSFFQHLLSGIRHLVMDTGAGFELGTNNRFAILTIVGSVLLTAALWIYFLGVVK
jgi:succinate dehydrogenase / fumarate reductase, cytochrome b subunit